MKRLSIFTLCLLLSSCGYHLMGMGRGMVPADVNVVRIMDAGNDAGFKRQWQAYVRDNASYSVISAASDGEADAELHTGRLTESLTPITYDATGITTVERMTLSGDITLWREGENIWSSGVISAFEDVDVSGGPTAIESARVLIRSDLETQWIRQAWLKLSSGF